jgi:hypothetical protein
MLATPVGAQPCADYVRSIAATIETLSRSDTVQFDFVQLHGHCHVDDARNLLIRAFLESECTDLFFIDADMGFKGAHVMRLLHAPGDIVAGVYCHKSDDKTYPFHPGHAEPIAPNEYGLYPMPKVATGFMRVRRAVIEALYEREKAKGRLSRPGDELGAGDDTKRDGYLPVARIVERGFPRELGLEKEAGNDSYTSGDYVLSLKARSLGFKCWIDPDMDFSHTGEKTWTGHFGNAQRERAGIWQTEFIRAVADLRAGNVNRETFERLVAHHGSQWPLRPAVMQQAYITAQMAQGDVLETGSGLSTLVLGLALAGTDRTVHSLEHDILYWQTTSKMLTDLAVPNVVLHYAPLVPKADGVAYGVEALPDVGMALLDGPPCRYGREGIVKALAPFIQDAMLVVDDAQREEGLVEYLQQTHDLTVKSGGGGRWWALGMPKRWPQVMQAAE